MRDDERWCCHTGLAGGVKGPVSYRRGSCSVAQVQCVAHALLVLGVLVCSPEMSILGSVSGGYHSWHAWPHRV